MGALSFADDITLLSPRLRYINEMLYICLVYADTFYILYVLSLYSMEGSKDDSNTEENNEFKYHILVNTVLAFTTYGLDTASDVNVNMILGETFCSEEIDTARDVLWETCHEGYLPEKKNRHTTDRRTGKQAKVYDILAWITILTQKQKRPKFVVDVKGLARMPMFQIESISEIALSDRVVKVESRISGLHSTVMHHILDVEVEMASLRKSLHSANNIEVAPPSGTTKSA